MVIKKEPFIKETMSRSIESTSSLPMGIQEGYNCLNPKSKNQTSSEIINIDDSENEIELNKEGGPNPRSNKSINMETNFQDIIHQQNLIEPTPIIVEFYSCPASDKISPCPNYDSEEKVRQHIAFFHKINFEAQMLCGLKIRKTVM